MRKIVALAAAWLAAAGLAVVVAWQGVGIVTNQVTDDRPAALAADDVRALNAEGARPADDAGPPTTPPAGEATATTVPPGTAGEPTPTSAPAAATPTTVAGATRPPTPTPTTTPTTTAPADGPAETRTYNLVGGSAALRFSPAGVTVVWATPAAGFEVDVEPEPVNGVQVEFESDDHRSRVTGWWDVGPRDEVREDDR